MAFNFILIDQDIDDGAFLEGLSLDNVESFEFHESVKLVDRFPSDVVMTMDKDDPDRRVLYDLLDNLDSLLIISSALKDQLEQFDLGEVEYLKIKIKDQRNKVGKEDYYIVNLLESIDYIDTEKSTIKYSALDPNRIRRISNIVIKEKSIPKNRALFRSKLLPNRYVVNEELTNSLKKSHYKGMMFVPVVKYNSALY